MRYTALLSYIQYFPKCKLIGIPESRKFSLWNPEYWALESRVQLLESRIPLKNESGISNRINGFHAHPCHHGHAKTQTADHLERGFLAGEFGLLQLARH